jgi:hypothetical protein
MHDERGDEVPRPEAAGSLGRRLTNPELPPALEDRVVRSLSERGVLHERRPRLWSRHAAMAVATAALFALGIAVGTRVEARRSSGSRATAPNTPRFALLLYGGPRDSPGVVDEYRRWARAVAAESREVSGEKLGDAGIAVSTATTASAADSAAGLALAGFFIISASSQEDAVAVARGSPHLRHGGTVVVRPIDPT